MLSRRQALRTSVTLALGGPIIVGCSPKKATNSGPFKVRFLTESGTRPRAMVAAVGKRMNIFRDAGLDVDIQPGQPGSFNLQQIMAANAEFAALNYGGPLQAALQIADQVKMIAAVHERTLTAWLAFQDQHITNPGDIAGKTVVMPNNAATHYLLKPYAERANFDPRTVKIVDQAPDGVIPLLVSGRAQLMTGDTVDVPVIEAAAHGRAAIALPFSQYLQDLYGTVLITSARMILQHPDAVRAFAKAFVASVNYSVNNPDHAGQLVHDAAPTNDASVAAASLRLMKSYVGNARLNDQRVAKGLALFKSAGVLPITALISPAQITDVDILGAAA